MESKVPNIKVTLCMASFNRLEESKIQIRRTSPHVDRTIVIDGGSWDGSIEFFNSEECKKLNVECYVHPWVDDPPGQRNKYLDLIKDGWVLVLDCDELLELPALYKLRYLAKEAESNNFDGIVFRAHDIQYSLETGEVYDSVSNYYNRIFFKYSRGVKYIGHTHVALFRPGMMDRALKTDYEYFHIKPEEDVYLRACRNYWTTCSVANNNNDDPIWKGFKNMTAAGGFKYFYEFAEYVKKGNIDKIYKDWFVAQRESDNPEARSWFISYFMFMHPEENIDKLENRDVKYHPDRKPVRLTA